jgi:hypothetical protein
MGGRGLPVGFSMFAGMGASEGVPTNEGGGSLMTRGTKFSAWPVFARPKHTNAAAIIFPNLVTHMPPTIEHPAPCAKNLFSQPVSPFPGGPFRAAAQASSTGPSLRGA